MPLRGASRRVTVVTVSPGAETTSEPPTDRRRIARLGTLAPLAVKAAYSLGLLSWDILHFEQRVDLPLFVVVAMLWLALVMMYVRELRMADSLRDGVLANLSYPLLLVAPLLIPPDTSAPLMILLIVAYILSLRSLTSGQAFAFSFSLIVFVAAMTSVAMVEVEKDHPESPLRDYPSALSWSMLNLLRVGDWAVGRPVSEDGRSLAILVGVCAVLAASLLTAQIVTWLAGTGPDNHQADDSSAYADELTRLRESVDRLTARLDATEQPRPTAPPEHP